ncbi:hypothetical protein Tco_1494846 [Tanacetum coccineum]
MNQVRKSYLDKFVIVFINDTFTYSRRNEEQEEHLSTPIFAFLEGTKNFEVYYDASHNGLGTMRMQKEKVEAFEKENVKDENLHGMDKDFETHLDGTLGIRSRSWLPR